MDYALVRRKINLGLFVWLIFLLGIQYALSYLFQYLGFNYYISDTLINIVLAFLFVNYRGYKKEAFKDPTFHKNVAIYFVVLMIFSLLFWFI